jgi:hypothetical protein
MGSLYGGDGFVSGSCDSAATKFKSTGMTQLCTLQLACLHSTLTNDGNTPGGEVFSMFCDGLIFSAILESSLHNF